MLEFLKQNNYFDITLFSFILNGFLLLSSIIIYVLLSKILIKRQFRNQSQPIYKKDILLSIVTLLCNVAIFVLGVFLWRNQIIQINLNAGILEIILKSILLLISMDFLMYFFHRMVHSEKLFPLIHKRHHEHDATNAISLFVLHPAEALGFGFLIILVLYIFNFPPESVIIYLSANLIWGTIGHLNVELLPKRHMDKFLIKSLGMAEFHNLHHQHIQSNFGFYTLIWDKLFGTLDVKYLK